MILRMTALLLAMTTVLFVATPPVAAFAQDVVEYTLLIGFSNSQVEGETSLDLAVEQGERPSVDRSHSITFGDGRHGRIAP